MQFLAIAGCLSDLDNTNCVLLALGKARKVTIPVAVQAATTVAFLVGFLLLELPNGIGWAMLAAATTVTLPNPCVWRTELSIPLHRALLGLWRQALGCIVMAAGGALAAPCHWPLSNQ